MEYPEKPNFSDIIAGSWQHGCIYAPLVTESDLKGLDSPFSAFILLTPESAEYLMSGMSLLIATLLNLRHLVRALLPHFILVAAFAAFVMWNGGVVLGMSIGFGLAQACAVGILAHGGF